jgi:hypothetical protein
LSVICSTIRLNVGAIKNTTGRMVIQDIHHANNQSKTLFSLFAAPKTVIPDATAQVMPDWRAPNI